MTVKLSVDSWFREIYVPRIWRVNLATELDFREKNRACFRSIGARFWRQPSTLGLFFEEKVMKTIFPVFGAQKLRVRIKDNKNSTHSKFQRFLFPFSSEFSDLHFPSYVFYNLPVLCHVSHTVSLGYLWKD